MIVFYTFLSVFLISLVSVAGVFFLSLKRDTLKKLQLLLVAFATGGLLGGAFFHLLPETFESFKRPFIASLWSIIGFLLFFVLEKFLHWHHNHTSGLEHLKKVKPLGPINLVADMFHNFLDGILIAASFSYSPEIGIITSVTVFFHELPQEIGDFGVLLHAGFSRRKALVFNFLSACTAFIGAALVLIVNPSVVDITRFILPVAAGGFIYLAAADLVPELHAEKSISRSVYQFLALLCGAVILIAVGMIME